MGNIVVPFEEKTKNYDDKWYKDWLAKQKAAEPIVYKGRKNKTVCWSFVNLCKMSQIELKLHVAEELCKYGYDVETGDGYIFAEGQNVPVLLTAHLDTVHAEPVTEFYEQSKGKKHKRKHILSSPQGIGGDDRCGVYMILEILRTTDMRPTILFCEDEEIGGVGSSKFLKTSTAEKIKDVAGLKFFVELDRSGSDDAVFYECITVEFIDFIEQETGYKEQWGTFSDISHLCPATGIAGVNLSCGYHKAHTLAEYVVLEEMNTTIEKTKILLKLAQSEEVPQFIYEERPKATMSGWYDYDDRWEDDPNKAGLLYIMWTDKEGRLKDEEIYADSKNAAIGQFLITHSDICWNNVEDYDWIGDSYYGYDSYWREDRAYY